MIRAALTLALLGSGPVLSTAQAPAGPPRFILDAYQLRPDWTFSTACRSNSV